MKQEDLKELEEGLELLKGITDELVIVHLTAGDFVLAPQKTFDTIVDELNSLRLKAGDLSEGVELLMHMEDENEKDPS